MAEVVRLARRECFEEALIFISRVLSRIINLFLSMKLGARLLIGFLAFVVLIALLLFMGMQHMFGGGWDGESFGLGGFVIGAMGIICFVIFGGKNEG
ncbi:hypothetical protein N9085_02500 [Akkermansiaceae bacterium]|nr:hypothetical protein [Akkermansiaceae bacterium]MDB4585679.1 hypothetical protein [Akkermansiaceae bacterium]